MTNRPYVLVDIDHTLSNAWWRDSLIGDWDAYHAVSGQDNPLQDVITMVNALHRCGRSIIGLTARPEKWRQLTMEWLVKHFVSMDELLMRSDDDFRPAPEVKVALALERFKDESNLRNQVALVLDDREDVIEAFRALGVTALQVFGRRV